MAAAENVAAATSVATSVTHVDCTSAAALEGGHSVGDGGCGELAVAGGTRLQPRLLRTSRGVSPATSSASQLPAADQSAAGLGLLSAGIIGGLGSLGAAVSLWLATQPGFGRLDLYGRSGRSGRLAAAVGPGR